MFANDTASVEQGAVAAVAYDRYEMGKITAAVIAKILKGHSSATIPVIYDAATQVVMNKVSVQILGLPTPADGQNIAWMG